MRKKLKYKNPYKTENELCNVLIEYAKNNGWKVYPETSSWDILLVKDIQIGVQAKLKDNIEVLAQAIEGRQSPNINPKWAYPSPHIRAVLVPRASREFRRVADELGVYIIEGIIQIKDIAGKKYWAKEINSLDKYTKKHLTTPVKLCWTPEVEIDVPAGVKSPRIVTEWKINAVKLCSKLRQQGYLTTKDFKEGNISITIWRKKWIIDSGEKINKLTKYVCIPGVQLPDELYPEITNAIEKWKHRY